MSRTIFLETTGAHVTLGRDDAELPATTLSQIKAQGLRGWVATVEGEYYGRGKLTLVMVREVEGAAAAEWNAAVAAFLKARPK